MVAKNTTAPKIRRFRCCWRIICNYLQKNENGEKSCNRKTGEKPRNQKKSNKNRIRNIKIIASKKREKDAKSKNIRFFQSRPRNHKIRGRNHIRGLVAKTRVFVIFEITKTPSNSINIDVKFRISIQNKIDKRLLKCK